MKKREISRAKDKKLWGNHNMKTFLVGLIFVLLMLTEDSFSELYSVAPDKELSQQVQKEADKLISVSPVIEKYFKITGKGIECTITRNKFSPLAYSENRLDGSNLPRSIVIY